MLEAKQGLLTTRESGGGYYEDKVIATFASVSCE